MRYNAPLVVDYGSIAEHTFTRCPGGNSEADMPKDYQVCEHDKFGECSCGATGTRSRSPRPTSPDLRYSGRRCSRRLRLVRSMAPHC